jgi:hypothetical protein
MRERLGARLHDPVFWNDVVQVLKTALAAILAWVLASSVFGLSQPFLAPWAALLVVHATVYRSFSSGAMQVAATFAAVLLAATVGQLLGLDTWAVAVVVVAGLFLGVVPWMGADTTTIASTAVVVLTTGYGDGLLFSRLIDTAIGVVVGLVVNFLVWPPLRRRTTIAAMDRIDDAIGDLLSDMASTLSTGCDSDDIGEWIERTRDLDGDVDHAWSMVRQTTESARLTHGAPPTSCGIRRSGTISCAAWNRRSRRSAAWPAPWTPGCAGTTPGSPTSRTPGRPCSPRPAEQWPTPIRRRCSLCTTDSGVWCRTSRRWTNRSSSGRSTGP